MSKISLSLQPFSLMLAISFCHYASADNSLAVVKNWYTELNHRPFSLERAEQIVADDLIDHNTHKGELPNTDKEALLYTHYAMIKGAPDARYQIQSLQKLADNRVLTYWRYKGTHTQAMFDLPATNKTFDIAGIAIFKIKDNKIQQIWHVEEISRLLEQIGLL